MDEPKSPRLLERERERCRFMLFHDQRRSRTMRAAKIEPFLAYLAVHGDVARRDRVGSVIRRRWPMRLTRPARAACRHGGRIVPANTCGM